MPLIADVTPSAGPTLEQMVTEIVTTAQGFAVAPDQMVALVGDITSTALSFRVDGECSPGVLEIEDELVYATAVDANTGTVTVHPRGRGWAGTVAAPHTAGEVVTITPALPRSRCAMLINDVVSSLYPAIFGVGHATSTSAEAVALEIPADAEFVLDVRYLDPNGDWQRVRSWETEMSASGGTTGKVVRIPSVVSGTSVQVVYGIRPVVFVADGQRWTDTGLGLAVKDLVVTGVLAKFAKTLDIGRLTDRFSTPKGDTQQPQLGAGFAMARQLQADFQAALDRETQALRRQYPARSHFVR